MNLALELGVIAVCLAALALFGAAEAAFYRVSPARLEMEARAGSRGAALVQRLARERARHVVVVLLGSSAALALLVWRATEALLARGVPAWSAALVLALCVAPVAFFAAELLGPELGRRRPHAALRAAAPLVLALRGVLAPLVALVARAAQAAAGRGAAGLESGAQGREAVLTFLRESQASGALTAHAEEMARNVLLLRSIPVARCMTPWPAVARVRVDLDDEAGYAAIAAATHTRIPIEDQAGSVLGYVHQLDVLGDGPGVRVLDRLRPIPELPADLPVDRALQRLRAAGQRLAVVGTCAAPVGIVTLKDLLEEISGDLARW